MWAPDTYDGAPTPVSAFLITASEAAGFAVLLRSFWSGLAPVMDHWQMILAVLAFVTMTFGNVTAIVQTRTKRMLAYSAIAQAGYILVGVAVATPESISAMLFYMMVYAFTTIGAFVVVVMLSNYHPSEEIEDFKGLAQRAPGFALAMAFFMLSLDRRTAYGRLLWQVVPLPGCRRRRTDLVGLGDGTQLCGVGPLLLWGHPQHVPRGGRKGPLDGPHGRQGGAWHHHRRDALLRGLPRALGGFSEKHPRDALGKPNKEALLAAKLTAGNNQGRRDGSAGPFSFGFGGVPLSPSDGPPGTPLEGLSHDFARQREKIVDKSAA